MRRHLDVDRRPLGLLIWVTVSSGLTIRDLWLAAHGGGTTPSWMLSAETAAWSVSAITGVAVLKSQAQPTDPFGSRTLEALMTATGAAAVAIHGVRLAIYSGARVTKQG